MKKILLGFLFILSINIGYANYEVEVSNINDYDFSESVIFAPNNGGYVKTIVSNSTGNKPSFLFVEDDVFYYDEINAPYFYEKYSYLKGTNNSTFSIIDNNGNEIKNISKKGYVQFSDNGKSYVLSLSIDGRKWFLYYDGKKSKSYDYISYYYGNFSYIGDKINSYGGNILIYYASNKKGKGIESLLTGDNTIKGGEQIIGINGQEYNLYDGMYKLGFSNYDSNKFAFGAKKDGKIILYKNGIEYGKYDEIGDIKYFDNGNLIFTAKKDGKWFIDKEGTIYKSNSIDILTIKFTTDGKNSIITDRKNTVIINENSNIYSNIDNISTCDENIKNGYIYCFGIKDIGPNYKKVYYRYDINKNTFEEYFTFNNKFTNTAFFQTTDNKNLLVNYENSKFYIYEGKIKINYGYDLVDGMKHYGDNYCFNTFNNVSNNKDINYLLNKGVSDIEKNKKNGRFSIIYNGKEIYENDGVYNCGFSKGGDFYYYTIKNNKYFLVFNGNNYPVYDSHIVMNFYSDNNGNFNFYTYKNGNLIINNNGQEYELKDYELLFQTDYVFFLKNKINYKKVMFVNGNFSNEYDDLDYSDIFHKYIIATLNGKKLVVSDEFVESQIYDNFGGYLGTLEDGSLILLGEKDGKTSLIINGKDVIEYKNISKIGNENGNIIITYEKNGKYYSNILYQKDLIDKYGIKTIKETPKTTSSNSQLDKILLPFFEKTDKKGAEIAKNTYKTVISKLDVLLKKKLSVKNKNTLNYLKEKVQEKIK